MTDDYVIPSNGPCFIIGCELERYHHGGHRPDPITDCMCEDREVLLDGDGYYCGTCMRHINPEPEGSG